MKSVWLKRHLKYEMFGEKWNYATVDFKYFLSI